jgi:hypothetical protein
MTSKSPRALRIECNDTRKSPWTRLRIPYPRGTSIAILVVLAYQVPKPQPLGSLGGQSGAGIALVLATFTAAEGAFA